MPPRFIFPLLCLGLAAPGFALADVNGDAVRACVAEQTIAGLSAAECVNRAQRGCFEFPPESTAAATLCFVEAKNDWSALIAARLDAIGEAAPPQIRDIAGIEVKYDLMTQLIQCDRMNELSLVTEDPSDRLVVQKARCEATAAGLTFVKLLIQSRTLE